MVLAFAQEIAKTFTLLFINMHPTSIVTSHKSVHTFGLNLVIKQSSRQYRCYSLNVSDYLLVCNN